MTETPPGGVADDAAAPGWEGGVAGRLANLAGARLVAQALGLVWFLYVARELGPRAFGVLSTGLALVVIVGGLSDLGTTRTVVRHVAAQPTTLRANWWRAGLVRVGAGLGVGGAVVLAMALVADEVPRSVVLLAGAVAVASGLTEVGFAALRATGRVGTEVAVLVLERVLFVVGGVAVVHGGGGPVGVLAVYAATNLVSALVVAAQVVRYSQGGHGPAGPLFDAEGRSTALSSTLVIVGPRVSVLLLVLLATPTVLGTFTLAQKVPEALGALGTAALVPVLALLRAALVGGRWNPALDRAGRITGAVAAAAAPVLVWLIIDSERALDLLFDAGQRRGATVALACMAAASLLWILRTLGEMVLLAEERAGRYLQALTAGLVVNLLVGVPMVRAWGAAGAAGSALVAEAVVFGVVVVALAAARGVIVRPVVAALTAAVAGAAVAMVGRSLPVAAAIVGVALVAAVALAITGRSLVGAGPAAGSGTPGDHADVGAQVGGDLAGDGIEAVEHGSGPAQHL